MRKEPWEIFRDAERDRWLKMIIGDYNWDNMELAFSFFERFDDPLEAADEMCKSPEVAIDIPVTRKAQKFSTHKSVLFDDLMRFCGKHDLIAYKYYTREWPKRDIVFHVICRSLR